MVTTSGWLERHPSFEHFPHFPEIFIRLRAKITAFLLGGTNATTQAADLSPGRINESAWHSSLSTPTLAEIESPVTSHERILPDEKKLTEFLTSVVRELKNESTQLSERGKLGDFLIHISALIALNTNNFSDEERMERITTTVVDFLGEDRQYVRSLLEKLRQ